MSTRATYRFSGEEWCPPTTIYIHYDGYPTGAAWYFYTMLTNPSKGSMATQFIRANDQAEVTESHECHGDTEYRYDLEGRGPAAILTGYKRYGFGETERWEQFFKAPLHEFFDKRAELIEVYHPFREVTYRYGRKGWLNLTTARAYLCGDRGPVSTLKVWRENGHDKGSGWDNYIAEVKSVVDVFPELADDADIASFLSTVNA